MLVTAEHISKKHNDRQILDDVSFTLLPKEKIGLVGVNGAGKSTFLKILAEVEHFEGKVMKMKETKIGYLAQHERFPEGMKAIDYVVSQMDEKKRSESLYEAKKTLHRFGIEDENVLLSKLSGGAKKRVALSSLLVNDYDVLLLDEPTNHLDEEMIRYLEKYLLRFQKAIIMVSHDRYFLERITTRIIEVDRCKLYSYNGNYQAFLEGKTERMERFAAHERKRLSLLKRESKWMAQGAQGRGTKSKQRIERFESLEATSFAIDDKQLSITTKTSRLGRKIIELEHVSFGYNEVLIRDFSYAVTRNDRIGILGKNGSGKTTLFQLLTKDLEPTSGSVDVGETVTFGYYRQSDDITDPSMRCIDYISESGSVIETLDGELSASALMELFLFSKNQQYDKIATLSGGERRRLYLLKVLLQNPNVLLFDEPTNDLDLTTLAILEEYLEYFKGALILISHDRYFLDQVCDRLFVFQEDQTLKQYIGGYSDYIGYLEMEEQENENKEKKYREQKNKNIIRFTYQESKEFEQIDELLITCENNLSLLHKDLSACGNDYDKMMLVQVKIDELEQQLEHYNERWLYLYDIHAQIEEQKK